MNSSKRNRLSYANVVATLALVFSMSGGALAAKHYLLTSTSQVSPKVLDKLKGHTGKTGEAGPAGTPGKEGAQGKEGTPGKNGEPGKEGQRGPSDVYETNLEPGSGEFAAGETKSISLAHLPGGSYAVYGRATIATSTTNAGFLRCILAGPRENDTALVDPPNHGSNSLDTMHTFTFPTESIVSMSCVEDDNKWSFDSARIVAVEVDSQHTEIAKVE